MSRLVRLFILLGLGLLAGVAAAQTTSVTAPANSITMGGAPISTGTAVLIPVDINGHPIAVTLDGGGLNLPGSLANPVGYSCAITNGALGSCPVPDEAISSPSGFAYAVTISDTSEGNPTSGLSFTLNQVRGITGASFELSDYEATASVPTVSAFSYTHGAGAPTGGCIAPAFYTADTAGTLYQCIAGAWVAITGSGSGAQIAGDLGGTLTAPRVTGIQGVPVSATEPTTGQSLVFDGAKYSPSATASAGVATVNSVAGAVTLLAGTNASIATSGSTITVSAPAPAGFPQQLLGLAGPSTAFGLDGKSWDGWGIGGPSNTIFLNGEYWMAVSGYPTAGFTAEAIGLWHSPSMAGPWTAYTGNPIITNTYPAWAANCIEGPDLNIDTAGNIYISFLGFTSSCDGEGPGSIGIVSTTTANFPTGWSAMPATATISKAANLNWLYRPFITEIGGICYDYSNAGDTSNNAIIVYYTTTGPCASTETSGPWTYTGTAITHSQAWEGPSGDELQDPQVFQDPSGLYILGYGDGNFLEAGYATTTNPAANNWVKLVTNPLQAQTAPTSTDVAAFILPRWTRDSTGQYWVMANYNGTTGMSLYKAIGPAAAQGPTYASNGSLITSTNPAWVSGVDSSGNYNLGEVTLVPPATGNGYWTAPTNRIVVSPGGGIGVGGAPVNLLSGQQSFTATDTNYPMYWWQALGAPTDEKLWRSYTTFAGGGNCVAGHSCWVLGVSDDSTNNVAPVIEIPRVGNTISGIYLDGTTYENGVALGSGGSGGFTCPAGTPIVVSGATAGSGAVLAFESGRPLNNCNFTVDYTPGSGSAAGNIFVVQFTNSSGAVTGEPTWTCTPNPENPAAAAAGISASIGAANSGPASSVLSVYDSAVPSSIIGVQYRCGP